MISFQYLYHTCRVYRLFRQIRFKQYICLNKRRRGEYGKVVESQGAKLQRLLNHASVSYCRVVFESCGKSRPLLANPGGAPVCL